MSKLGLDVTRSRSGSLKDKDAPNGKARAAGKERSVNASTTTMTTSPSEDDDDTVMTPIQPSAKALGKRRAETPPEESTSFARIGLPFVLNVNCVAFDPDDIFKERVPTPLGIEDPALALNSDNDDSTDSGVPGPDGAVHHKHHVVYAYDAAAEREREWLQEIRAHPPPAGQTPVTST